MDFELRNVEMPILNPDESLIRVLACGICGTDLHEYRRKFDSLKKWRRHATKLTGKTLSLYGKEELRLGHEICGIVEKTNKPELQGRKVVVFPDISCGTCWACQHGINTACESFSNIGFERAGGFAEYVSIPDTNLIKISESVDPSVATLAEPLACALHALEMSELKKKDNVLVLGAGPIGLLITYICKREFSSDIVACDLSSFRLNLAKEMGATSTIPPNELDSMNLFPDVIFDVTGGHSDLINHAIRVIRPRGTICIEGFYEGFQPVSLRGLQAKEARILTSRGTNQKNQQDAVQKIEKYFVDLRILKTHSYSLENISEAFMSATNHERNKAVKTVIKP